MPSRKLPFDEDVDPKDFGTPRLVRGQLVWKPPAGMDRKAARLLAESVKAANKLIKEGRAKINRKGSLKVRG